MRHRYHQQSKGLAAHLAANSTIISVGQFAPDFTVRLNGSSHRVVPFCLRSIAGNIIGLHAFVPDSYLFRYSASFSEIAQGY
jgi:hypothetical protein